MNEHTLGPWKFVKRVSRGQFVTDRLIVNELGSVLANFGPVNDEANCLRAVDCVNACEGIEDPVEAIKLARVTLSRAIENLNYYSVENHFMIQECRDAINKLGGIKP